MNDLTLAVIHHLGVFALFGVLVAEFVVLSGAVTVDQVRRVAGIDRAYGLLSLLVIGAGVARAVFAAKGWDYYAGNAFFWAKMGAFAGVGALSVLPSLRFVQWRRADQVPDPAQVRLVRRLLHAQLALFALLPVFAAAMARGYGSLH